MECEGGSSKKFCEKILGQVRRFMGAYVYGRTGSLSQIFGVQIPLYGLTGILLAHVFFNMPLAVRLLLQGYSLIPSGQWRQASQLGFSRWTAFYLIEWHYMKKVLPGSIGFLKLNCYIKVF